MKEGKLVRFPGTASSTEADRDQDGEEPVDGNDAADSMPDPRELASGLLHTSYMIGDKTAIEMAEHQVMVLLALVYGYERATRIVEAERTRFEVFKKNKGKTKANKPFQIVR